MTLPTNRIDASSVGRISWLRFEPQRFGRYFHCQSAGPLHQNQIAGLEKGPELCDQGIAVHECL